VSSSERNKFAKYSMRKISARSASSRRTPGGREVFIVQEILWIMSLTKSREHKVCVGDQISLRRSNSGGVTQKSA
jgi:hypothetical protein